MLAKFSDIADIVLVKCGLDSSTDTKVNAGILGTGMVAPFMGLIGEKKITQDPYYNKNIPRMDSKSLERMAQPGDIVMTSTRDTAGYYKKPQLALTGSEFYHAEPVISRTKKNPITAEAGLFNPDKNPRYKKDTVESILEKSKGTPMGKRVSDSGAAMYEDAVLLRPKKKMTPEQLLEYRKTLAGRGRERYSGQLAVRAYLRDMFLPKIKRVTDATKPLGAGCEGEMCSSLPSTAYEKVTGTKMSPGKHSRSVLPADLLRSNSPYEAVGSALRNEKALATPGKRLAKRLALRGGVGAALAGTGLLAYNEPEAIGGLAAGAAAPMGVRAIADHLTFAEPNRMRKGSLKRNIYKKLQDKIRNIDMDIELPKTTDIMGELEDHLELVRRARESGTKHVMTSDTKRLLKNLIKKKGGIAAGAGLGTYGLLKYLTSQRKSQED